MTKANKEARQAMNNVKQSSCYMLEELGRLIQLELEQRRAESIRANQQFNPLLDPANLGLRRFTGVR